MKALPWILSVLLAIACAGLVFLALHERTKAKTLAEKFLTAVDNEKAMQQKIKDLETAATLKPLPLKVGHRTDMSGGILTIENHGSETIKLDVTVKRGEEIKELPEVAINSNGDKSIGQTEGWGFVSGDEIEFKSNGYRTVHFKFP
jgi:hypothetical protein